MFGYGLDISLNNLHSCLFSKTTWLVLRDVNGYTVEQNSLKNFVNMAEHSSSSLERLHKLFLSCRLFANSFGCHTAVVNIAWSFGIQDGQRLVWKKVSFSRPGAIEGEDGLWGFGVYLEILFIQGGL